MSRPPDRPDPDRLLAEVQADEARQRRGRLKLFFGAGEVQNWARSGDAWIYDMAGGKPE